MRRRTEIRRWVCALIILGSVGVFGTATIPGEARAAGLTETGEDLRGDRDSDFELDGYLRGRGELFYNLDLDRGPTPSGEYLYPLPLGNPSSPWLTHGDMRLRTDASFYPEKSQIGVHLRVDVLDNLAVGSTPQGTPLTTTSQAPPETQIFQIKRAYGEALTPIGLIAVGRMGAHWGLGMLANSGDCRDCDTGDAADRVAYMAPVFGHIFGLAFDVAYRGPLVEREPTNRVLDLDPSDNVRTVTAAFTKFRREWVRERRRRAGRSTFDYGAWVSHRWQRNDVPVHYLPTTDSVDVDSSQVMARGYKAIALDGWLRFVHPKFKLELEAAYLGARIEQASLIPGTRLEQPITSRQFGAAFESSFGSLTSRITGGIDAGFASGDEAPGFGADLNYRNEAPQAGDLNGPQSNPPGDIRVNNFRFHPDYHVDEILFREIIGTVTDATYLRPHLEWLVAEGGPSKFLATVAAPVSWAVKPNSAPGQASPLGVEVDPSLVYVNERGFRLAFDYGVLFPFEGLSNAAQGIPAQPAQKFKLTAMYTF